MIIDIIILIVVLYVAYKQHTLSDDIAVNYSRLGSLKNSAARVEETATEVASDLADAHIRAEEVLGTNHGEAADRAAEPTLKEKISKGVL